MNNYMDFGDKNLQRWIRLFTKKQISTTKYISLLKNTDKYFLTMSPPKDIDDEINNYIPDNGLLENDLLKVLYNKEGAESAKTRLAISIANNVNFNPWKKKYKKEMPSIIEKCLIEGAYERYDFKIEKIIPVAIAKNLIDKDDFMGIAILRGVLLSSRYPDESSKKKLKRTIFINKLKTLINI